MKTALSDEGSWSQAAAQKGGAATVEHVVFDRPAKPR